MASGQLLRNGIPRILMIISSPCRMETDESIGSRAGLTSPVCALVQLVVAHSVLEG